MNIPEQTITQAIKQLAEKSKNTPDAPSAMQFTQAALNLANTLMTLNTIKKEHS